MTLWSEQKVNTYTLPERAFDILMSIGAAVIGAVMIAAVLILWFLCLI